MPDFNRKTPLQKPFLIPFIEGIAITAGVIIIALGSLLIANWFQLTYNNPLDTPVLEILTQRSRANPEDTELVQQLRLLDLVARKAYFTRRWQAVTGCYILAGALVLLAGALFIRERLQRRAAPAGQPENAADRQRARAAARWLNAAALAVLGTFALVLTAREGRLLTDIPAPGAAAEQQSSGDTQPSALGVLSAYTPAEKARYTSNWPSFRGPWSAAYAPDITAPTDWDGATGRGVVWKIPLPLSGFNSPIIWNERIFFSAGDEKVFEVTCLERRDGSLLWQQQVKRSAGNGQPLPDVSEDTGYAAPGMACDGTYVFALFASGDLAAFTLAGEPAWQLDLGVPDINYGQASSLITYAGRLFVQYDQPSGARLLIIDSTTGRILSTIPREISSSWASPLIADLPERPLLILSGNPYVTAYDILQGSELWRTECMNGEVAPSPAFAGDIVYAANEFASLFALNAASGEILWEFYDDLPNVSSPAAAGNYLFVATSYGVVSCLDSREGTVLWLHEFDEGFYSSPVIAGELVYLCDLSGTTRIFRAAASYEEVGSGRIEEEIVSTPAFAHGRLYLRGAEHFYCIGTADE